MNTKGCHRQKEILVYTVSLVNKREWCIFQWVAQVYSEKENLSSPNRSQTYHLPITSSDALPLSYRRLVGAKAIKLGSCDKHSAYCWGFECRCMAYPQCNKCDGNNNNFWWVVHFMVVHFRVVHQGSPLTGGPCFVHHHILSLVNKWEWCIFPPMMQAYLEIENLSSPNRSRTGV